MYQEYHIISKQPSLIKEVIQSKNSQYLSDNVQSILMISLTFLAILSAFCIKKFSK